MRRLLLFILVVFILPLNSIAQQQVSVHNIVTVTLPKDANALTKEELAALAPPSDTTSVIVYKTSSLSYEQFNGESFKLKNLLIQLNAASALITPKPGFLEQRKKETDDLFSIAELEVYNTSIKRWQHHAAVITHYVFAGDTKGYFHFASYNSDGSSILVSILEYPKGDKETAEQTFYEMLEGIRFMK